MKHLFIEYVANDMLPGDWGWYVATYKVERTSGCRDWRPDGRVEAAIYEFPERFGAHCLVPIQYTRSVALGYGEKPVKAPHGVRSGVILAVHDTLIRDIGESEFAEDAFVGPIKTRDGILPDWRVALVKESIRTPIGSDDSTEALARHLPKRKITDSDKYSLILREDLAWKLSSARFPGCSIHWAESSHSKNA